MGRLAEELVAKHLEARGWVIAARNLRLGRHELDLVAWEGRTLVVVEVRARRRGAMVDPWSSITSAKRAKLREATRRLVHDWGADDVRVDGAAVVDGEIDYLENIVSFEGY